MCCEENFICDRLRRLNKHDDFNKIIFSIFKFLETAKDGLLLLSDILPCVVYC